MTLHEKTSLHHPRVLRWLEALARVAAGAEVKIVAKSRLDQLERLAYREKISEAARAGDGAFIESEITRNQLSADDLVRLQKHDTPMRDWPDVDSDIFGDDEKAPANSKGN